MQQEEVNGRWNAEGCERQIERMKSREIDPMKCKGEGRVQNERRFSDVPLRDHRRNRFFRWSLSLPVIQRVDNIHAAQAAKKIR